MIISVLARYDNNTWAYHSHITRIFFMVPYRVLLNQDVVEIENTDMFVSRVVEDGYIPLWLRNEFQPLDDFLPNEYKTIFRRNSTSSFRYALRNDLQSEASDVLHFINEIGHRIAHCVNKINKSIAQNIALHCKGKLYLYSLY